MFRKTFIRVVLCMSIAATALIALASAREYRMNQQSCQSKKESAEEKENAPGELMILQNLRNSILHSIY